MSNVQIGGFTIQMGNRDIWFLQPGTSWTPEGGTGATGNRYVGPVSTPREARIVAYHLLLWAEERERASDSN